MAEVDALCLYPVRLAGTEEPWPALVAWVRRVPYMATKRVLLDALDRDSGTFRARRDALHEFGEPLLTRAQATDEARADLTIDEVLRFIVGVTGTPFGSEGQRERILDMAIAGIANPTPPSSRTAPG